MGNRVYQKVHIIGGAGSGKTTLARWLAEKLAYPHYDLDQIGWDQNGKVSLEKRLGRIENILSQPTWITEGIFLWWTSQLFEQADVIVWLDIPYPVAAWRIVIRHIKASLRGNNPHAGIRNLVNFVLGVRQQYQMKPKEALGPDDDFAITRIAIIRELEKYSEKVEHCKTAKDVERFRASIR